MNFYGEKKTLPLYCNICNWLMYVMSGAAIWRTYLKRKLTFFTIVHTVHDAKYILSNQPLMHWNVNKIDKQSRTNSKGTTLTDIRSAWWWHSRSAETYRSLCIVFTCQCMWSFSGKLKNGHCNTDPNRSLGVWHPVVFSNSGKAILYRPG
jgi:hypothetical protein